MEFYDLSVYWEANPMAEPWPPEVQFSDSASEAVNLSKKLGIRPSDFQDGLALAVENVNAEVFTHVGTHCDAPYILVQLQKVGHHVR